MLLSLIYYFGWLQNDNCCVVCFSFVDLICRFCFPKEYLRSKHVGSLGSTVSENTFQFSADSNNYVLWCAQYAHGIVARFVFWVYVLSV